MLPLGRWKKLSLAFADGSEQVIERDMVLWRDEAGRQVQDKRDGPGMAWADSNVDSDSCSVAPLGALATSLHIAVQDVGWTTKGMVVLGLWTNGNGREAFQWALTRLEPRGVVVDVIG